MRRLAADLRSAFWQVFARPSYAALAVVVALLALALAVLAPNLGLVAEVLGSSASLAAKLRFALSLLGGIETNFSPFSAAYSAAIAVVFGADTAMIAYLLRHRRAVAAGRNIALGAGGVASGVVGIGCAACGSLISGALFSALGATGALAALPLQGGEFGILSVALLALSLVLVGRTIARPAACRAPER